MKFSTPNLHEFFIEFGKDSLVSEFLGGKSIPVLIAEENFR